MARSGITDVETIAGGSSLQSGTKGAFIRNMAKHDDSWTVRSGFGQLVQHDTSLSLRDTNNATQGQKVHLGSKAFITDFGHTQILSVFSTRAFTAAASNGAIPGSWQELITVEINDLSTNTRWEEVLYRHTAENNPDVSPMPSWRGTYETSSDADFSAWVRASDNPVFITEYADNILFGSSRIGIWAYIPTQFDGNRRKWVNSHLPHNINEPYSESSLVVRIHPIDGLFARAYPYLNSADYPSSPHDVASIYGALAIATKRDVYFSDPGSPASIINENIITIPSEQEITAIREVNDALLIFTENETWHYMPSTGTLMSRGRLSRISPDIGCLAPSSLTPIGEAILWVDRNGVYVNNGGLTVTQVSSDIEPFFTSHMTDPLSSFRVANGGTDLTQEQPRLTYRLDPQRVSCAYDPAHRYAYIAVPDLNFMLALHVQSQAWSFWPLESMASGTTVAPTPTVVGRQSNLTNPWVTVVDQRVFLVTGVESHTFNDVAVDPATGNPYSSDNITTSYIISELGRGGGLDRSVDALEDQRQFMGQHTLIDALFDEGDLYIGEPTKLADGYRFPGGIPSSPGYPNGRVRSNTLLFPVYMQGTTLIENATTINLALRFDNAHWRVVTRSAADPIIELIFPPERAGSAEGWGVGFAGAVAGTAECQIYDSGTGVPSPTGDEMRIRFDATLGAGRKPWSYATLNNPAQSKIPLFYLPVEILNPTTQSLSALGIFKIVATANGQALNIWVYDYAHASDKHEDDDVAQPVDYAHKSAQIGLKNATQLQYRGVFIRSKTRGQASAPLFPNNPFKTMNVVAGSDWNSWTSQTISWTGDDANIAAVQETLDKLPIRSRVVDATSNATNPRSFNQALNTWGDANNLATGTYLIDEVEADSLAVSDSVKGEYIDVMIFGMIRSPAESLTLESVRASLRNVHGGRRRRGR